MQISLQSNEDKITFKVIKKYRCMLNGREGGRERDIRSDTWESSHSGIGFIEFDNEFKMKQPFVIMIMN